MSACIFVVEKQKNMKKLVYTNATYQIWQLGKENLYTLAEFVVKENYKHHTGSLASESIRDEIEAVYQEERSGARQNWTNWSIAGNAS